LHYVSNDTILEERFETMSSAARVRSKLSARQRGAIASIEAGVAEGFISSEDASRLKGQILQNKWEAYDTFVRELEEKALEEAEVVESPSECLEVPEEEVVVAKNPESPITPEQSSVNPALLARVIGNATQTVVEKSTDKAAYGVGYAAGTTVRVAQKPVSVIKKNLFIRFAKKRVESMKVQYFSGYQKGLNKDGKE
jgi:hypothetical protein